jgi:zinc transport system ATP-binding protein
MSNGIPASDVAPCPPSHETCPLVTVRGLRVALGGKEILKGVDADLARGKVTALIGLNGAGKSTLLRALLKEVPYAGQVRFHCGHDHSRPTPEHIGYVPQKLRIEANLPLTVEDLFALALQRRPLFFGVARPVRQYIAQLLERVGAQGLLRQPVEKLSGGELQRVLLALALEPEPELLLLDEPAAGIDFQEEERFYDLIAGLNRQTNVTILLVSHDTSVVSRMAHHVLCLRDGLIQCQGAPQEVVTEANLARVFGAGKAVYSHHHSDPHLHPHRPDDRVAR